MRIAVDARPLAYPWNGIGTYLRELLERLIPDSEHDWVLYSDRPINTHLKPAQIRTGNITKPWLGTGYTQLRYPGWTKRDRCDVFWSPRHQLPLGLPRNLPKVVTLHDLVFRLFPETMAPGGLWLERLLTPPSLRISSAIITTSQSATNDLATCYPQLLPKVTTTPLSSSLDQVVPYADQSLADTIGDTPFALYCGSLEPRKNLPRLLQAFSQARQTGNLPHHLVVVSGGGWNDIQVREQLARNAQWVHLVSAASEATKAWLYQQAAFTLLPSLYEGFGIPLVESLKMGKAMITSDRSAMPEVAGDAALYVDPTNVAAIAEAIHSLCSDQQRRTELEQNALRRATQFSWQRSAQLTLAALERAVA